MKILIVDDETNIRDLMVDTSRQSPLMERVLKMRSPHNDFLEKSRLMAV